LLPRSSLAVVVATILQVSVWMVIGPVVPVHGAAFFRVAASTRYLPNVLYVPRGGSDSADEVTTAAATDSSIIATNSGGGGEATSSFASDLELAKSRVWQTLVAPRLAALSREIDSGIAVENFGATADQVVNDALEALAAAAAPTAAATSAASAAAALDAHLSQLEAAVDAPLHVLYLKLLSQFRETALQQYRASGGSSTTGGSYAAILQADADFVRQATAATRDGSDDWDYGPERSFLQSVLSLAADASQKATDVQLAAATQQQTAMSFLQSQQQMIQQLQSQLYGQTSPWNVGVAYRIPDTNFNVQGSYQQGRANVQLSCVPDEYAPFLGPSGFTNGVGPGNLGLSLNLSL
jgi:hypothetical protein